MLPIAISPVIAGPVLTTVYGVFMRYTPLRAAIPVWLLQFLLTVLFVCAYVTTARRVRCADRNDKGC
jgi:ABC-type sulfate transport system permease subunit